MIQHYKDLLKLYWLRILVGAIVAGVLTFALSVLLLKVSPSYKAELTFNMQPSEEALAFNRQFLGVSQFNPATIITETHIERLLSRPIAERTLDTLLEGNVQGPPIESTFFASIKLWLWRSWTRLNYGEYRPLPERDQLLNDLLEALDVEPVEGSYILKLTATYKFPTIAADIANMHAQSYIMAASEEFRAQVDQKASFIRDLINSEEAALVALLATRDQLRDEFDIANLSRESEILISSLQSLRDKLDEDVLQRSLRENEVATSTIDGTNGRIRGELDDLGGEIDILNQRINFREQQIAEQSAELAVMSRSQLNFDSLELEIEEIEARLANLRQQVLSFELGAQANSSQIQIVSPALVPVYPASPKVLLFTVMAVITGAVLVFITVVLQELFGTAIRTSYDLVDHVGSRAMPTLSKSDGKTRRGGKNNRRVNRFVKAFGQQMSVGSGWRTNKIFVTGFVPQETLIDVRNLLGKVVSQSIVIDAKHDPFQVTAIGPIYSVKDWDSLGECQIVVVMEPNTQSSLDVESLRHVSEKTKCEPLFMLWV